MATISSLGIGTNGLDVNSIVSQLVAIEKQPLDKLKLEAAATQTKISTFGQIKSLVSTLNDAAAKLASVTGWNAVTATSSDTSYVTTSAIGGTQPTAFDVQVQTLAKAQATHSAAILPVGGAVGAGTIRLELGSWSGATFSAGSGTPVDLTISATDTVADIASKINGANAGVTATILSDASGDRLLLRGKSTGAAAGFNLSVTSDADSNTADALGLSRLVTGSVTDQAAQDAAATINGIPVSSSTNTFANKVAGVTFTAVKETTGPVTITIDKSTSEVEKNIQAFVDAYNAVNGVLNEATKYDASTKTAGLLQGDSTTLSLQSALRSAVQSVRTGSTVFSRLSDIGIETLQGGNLKVNSTKLSAAMTDNMDELKAMFTTSASGTTQGFGLRFKNLLTGMLGSTDGFFANKDAALKRTLTANSTEQTRVNNRASTVEATLKAKYNALDTQMSQLNSLSSYITQQITQWNKSTG